jgi:hypothetical protein
VKSAIYLRFGWSAVNCRSSTFGAMARVERMPPSFGKARRRGLARNALARINRSILCRPHDTPVSRTSRQTRRAIGAGARHEARPHRRHAKLYLVGNKIRWDLAQRSHSMRKCHLQKPLLRIQDSNFEWSTMKLTRLRGKDIPLRRDDAAEDIAGARGKNFPPR